MKKRIGILGGMSPESTAEMYLKITSKYFTQFNNNAYPEIVIFSVNFQEMIALQDSGDKEQYVKDLMAGINALADAGAEFCVIASNTPHMVYEKLSSLSRVPILSIVESTAKHAEELGLKKLLLTGTIYTMNADFYKVNFEKRGIQVIVPDDEYKKEINRIVFDELGHGIVKGESKKWFKNIIESYDVEGVILGCTELPMLISPKDTRLILLDTLDIHAEETLQYSLQ